jgi:hypothetical protein
MTIGEIGRWCLGADAVGGTSAVITPTGAHDVPVVMMTVSALSPGKTMRDFAQATAPDEVLVFMLPAEGALDLAERLRAAAARS